MAAEVAERLRMAEREAERSKETVSTLTGRGRVMPLMERLAAKKSDNSNPFQRKQERNEEIARRWEDMKRAAAAKAS